MSEALTLGGRAQARSLRLSVLDGAFYAIMLGCSESFLGAFAVELGHSSINIGLLASVPMLAGALAALGSGAGVSMFGGWRRFVVAGAGLQALSHVGFWWLAVSEERSLAPFLFFKVCFWVSGSAIGPAWGTWMAHLTENLNRERYFAWRSSIVQAVLVISLAGGGLLLNGRVGGALLSMYGVLFVIAMIARGASTAALAAQGEHASSVPHAARTHSYRAAVAQGSWRVPLSMGLLMFGVFASSPFFTPYMLIKLHLTYLQFVGLSCVSILCKALVLPFAHRLVDRLTLRAVFIVATLCIAAIPIFWIFAAGSLTFLVVAHVWGGIAWALHEYSSFQILLRMAPANGHTEYLGLAATIAAVGQLFGSIVGGVVLSQTDNAFEMAFAASLGLRTIAVLPFLWGIPMWGSAQAVSGFVTRLLSVRPGAGASSTFYDPRDRRE